MATTHNRVTRQRVGSSESAAGQGGKAGPQASSSSYRSSTSVGNLADVESNATSQSPCKNNPDIFCIVCGRYTAASFRFSETLKKKYKECFAIEIDSLSNCFTPNVICSRCRNILNKTKKQIFSSPMKWRKPSNHVEDCYFCSTTVFGYNRKNKKSITYGSVASVTFPVYIDAEHNDNSMDVEPSEQEVSSDADHTAGGTEMQDQSFNTSKEEVMETHNISSSSKDENNQDQQKFSQVDLSDLCRDLGLSKESSELLASRLKEKNCLTRGTHVSYYRTRDKPFRKFFRKTSNLVYCSDVNGLVEKFEIEYESSHWRLFIDSSTRSLKAILLHNGNVYAPLPVAHSVVLNEEYHDMHLLLQKLKYDTHKWDICGDLKISAILLGLQKGFTSYPCFLCEWNSRARDEHYKRVVWPPRKNLTPGVKNVEKVSLVPSYKVLLPPLHIKLGIVKQFVKAMSRVQSAAFMHIFQVLPSLSEAKINEGIFTGPQIRELLKNKEFERLMTDKEKAAWQSFREVTKNFFGNNKDPDYKNIVSRMLNNFNEVGCLMNLKLHFMHSHIDYFPENLGDFSEEQGERMHQDLREFEKKYQGVWGKSMLADYCWSLQRESNDPHKRKAIRRTFTTERKRFRADE